MDREIKFRGKRIDNGEWVYGDLIHYFKEEVGIIPQNEYYEQVHPETIGQYTGLKDRDGKKIYENDIVRVSAIGYRTESGVYDIYSIRFAWGSFYLYDLNSGFDDLLQDVSDECEIIGNIHEHPELLKQQQ